MGPGGARPEATLPDLAGGGTPRRWGCGKAGNERLNYQNHLNSITSMALDRSPTASPPQPISKSSAALSRRREKLIASATRLRQCRRSLSNQLSLGSKKSRHDNEGVGQPMSIHTS